MPIYRKVFDLRGTTKQQQIVIEALEAIKFPFELLKFPKGTAIIGWANLNGQALATDNPLANETGTPHLHQADHPATDTDTEPLEGEINGRKYVLGVFYPSTGNIYIDNALVNYPSYAKTTVSAEIAHSVDEFLPLTDAQRQEIMTLVHHGDATDHGHSWWEKYDYGTEYYHLVGETFMILFTYAYSDMEFEGASDFTHAGDKSMAPQVRKIIGIERTDYVAPPEPTPPMPEPEIPESDINPEIEPEPEIVPEPIVEEQPTSDPAPVEPTTTPEPELDKEGDGSTSVPSSPDNSGDDSVPDTDDTESFVRYGKSKIYHLPTHYTKKTNGVEVEDTSNMRLCKVCQKRLPIDNS